MRRRIFVVASIWMLFHLYVGFRLLPDLGLGHVGIVAAGVLLALIALSPFVAFLGMRRDERPIARAVHWVAYVALGFSSILIVLVLASDVFFLRAWGVRPEVLAPSLVGMAALLTAVGAWGAQRPRIVHVAVPIPSLPADLEGFRIVQLSDLHIGPTIRRPFVQTVVDAANGLRPDLIALTGDVADGTVPNLRGEVEPLAGLAAPFGKFYVTGNHEYYWDSAGWTGEVTRLGFDVLTNAHRLLERGKGRLLVAGVTDASASHIAGQSSDPVAALAGAPASDVKVLLAHQPRSAFAAQAAGFDLQLSGHTHGGQYFPFNLLVHFFQPFVAGLHHLEEMWLYVSRGTGYWGPPIRLGAPSEITLIELVAQ